MGFRLALSISRWQWVFTPDAGVRQHARCPRSTCPVVPSSPARGQSLPPLIEPNRFAGRFFGRVVGGGFESARAVWAGVVGDEVREPVFVDRGSAVVDRVDDLLTDVDDLVAEASETRCDGLPRVAALAFTGGKPPSSRSDQRERVGRGYTAVTILQARLRPPPNPHR